MHEYFNTEEILKQFKIHSYVAGGLLLIAGIIGILLPDVTALTLSYFIGWLLVIGGTISAYHIFKSYNTKWIAWFKPLILLTIGILILLYPLTGIVSVGLLLIIYFLFDGFAGIMFALEFYPLKGWGWMLFNAILSILLAVVFLTGWPLSSIWLVGLFVGISLVFDGIAIISVAYGMKQISG